MDKERLGRLAAPDVTMLTLPVASGFEPLIALSSYAEPLRAYCRAEGVEIVAEFPDDRRIAEVQAHGARVVEALPDYRGKFEALLATALARGSA